MLNNTLLSNASSELDFTPEIDLFASRLNAQFPQYVAYRPDPGTRAVDAFTIDWSLLKVYTFPPFSIIVSVLKKIKEGKATGVSSSETQGLLAGTMRYFRAKVYLMCWRAPGNLFLPNQFQKWSEEDKGGQSHRRIILGNPGATSRDDAIFSGESLLNVLKSPWELILTEPVPEVVEFRSTDWAEKYFSAQSSAPTSLLELVR